MPLQEDDAFRHKYQFLETIGAGGMGIIYKARQTAINRIVAIKLLQPGYDSNALRRFQTEATAASKLSNKYIVTVHDMGTSSSGQPFIVMDYLDGKTLAQYLTENGPLKSGTFVRFFLQICDALQHAHSRSVLHRDLKPSNIMIMRVDGAEEVRIMDFGIAKVLDDTVSGAQQLTKTGEAIGSPLYMSPEQCRGAKLDVRSDLYSLGCVMYESVTGAPPFLGGSSLETMMMHLEKEPLPLSQASLGLEIDQGLQDIILRLLKKDPSERYQSVNDLETDLLNLREAIISGKCMRFIYKEPAKPDESRKSSWRNLVIYWPFLALVLVGLIGFCIAMAIMPPPLKNSPTQKEPTQITSLEEDVKNKSKISYKEMVDIKVKRRSPDLDLSQIMKDLEDMSQPFNQDDLQPLQNATSSLVNVRLYGPNVNDKGLGYLKNLRLRILGLEHTDVTTLEAIRNMTTLEALNVSYTRIGASAMRLIGGLHNLKALYLQGTGIDDGDLKQLDGLNKLATLNLTSCSHLSQHAIQQLKAALPRCEVLTSESAQSQVSGAERQQLDDAWKLRNQGKWALAEAKYGSLLSALQQESIPNNQLMASVLAQRAECNCYIRHYDTAIKCCQTAVELLGSASENELQLADVLMQEASAIEAKFNGTADYKKAAQQAMKCREQADHIFDKLGSETTKTWDNINQLASDYECLGDNQSAAQTLARGIERCTQANKIHPVPPDIVYILYSHQAGILETIAATQDKGESQNKLRRKAAYDRETAWKVRRNIPASKDPHEQFEIQYKLLALAADYQQLNDTAAAQRVLDAVLTEDDKSLHSGSLAPRAQAFADCQKAQAFETKATMANNPKQHNAWVQQAIELRLRAKKIYQANGGADVPSLTNLVELGGAYTTISQFDQALKIFNQAEPQFQNVANASLLLASLLHTRGYTNQSLHRYADAAKDWEAAEKIYRLHPAAAGTSWQRELLVARAIAHYDLAQYSKSEALLRKALDTPCQNPGLIKETYERMYQTLSALHKDAEAATFRAKATEAAQKLKQQG
jgi:serine/threonine protein kinase